MPKKHDNLCTISMILNISFYFKKARKKYSQINFFSVGQTEAQYTKQYLVVFKLSCSVGHPGGYNPIQGELYLPFSQLKQI